MVSYWSNRKMTKTISYKEKNSLQLTVVAQHGELMFKNRLQVHANTALADFSQEGHKWIAKKHHFTSDFTASLCQKAVNCKTNAVKPDACGYYYVACFKPSIQYAEALWALCFHVLNASVRLICYHLVSFIILKGQLQKKTYLIKHGAWTRRNIYEWSS